MSISAQERINKVSKRLLLTAKRYQKVADHLDSEYIKAKEKHYYSTPESLVKALTFYENKNPLVMACKDGTSSRLYNIFLPVLHASCAYRVSPINYIIDTDYCGEIKPIHPDTPASIFNKIPHLTFYLDYPIEGHQGFLISKIKEEDGRLLLSIYGVPCEEELLRIESKASDKLKDDMPILMNLAFGLDLSDRVDNTVGKRIEALVCYLSDSNKSQENVADFRKTIEEVLSVLLWFCVQEPDISDFEGKILTPREIAKPVYHRNKAGKLLPLGKPITRIIGGRLGGEIRKFKQLIDSNESEHLKLQGQRTVRPHIRAGHWHGYWVGVGDNKEYTVKWLNATLVNAKI